MTNIYSIDRLNAEHDSKEVSTIGREITKFRENNPNRSFTPVYHDEQIPIDTRYKQDEVSFAYVSRWTGAPAVNPAYISKDTPVSIKGDGDGIIHQETGEIESSGKVWASQKEYTISMIAGLPPRVNPKDNVDDYDWMWRVFDKKHRFTDNGRKINIDWGSAWTKVLGSLPAKNILEEEIRGIDKFFEDSDSENEALASGDWHSVVEAHLHYFQGGGNPNGAITKIMKRYVDKLVVEEAVAVAFLAMCEFAKRISDDKEKLNARFATSVFSVVWTAYRDALEERDVINMKTTRQKSEDRRTLNDFLRQFKKEFFREATIEEICKGLEWGELRAESTFKMFDFNIGKYRPMNDEEMLYTVMDNHLTERQAQILEMNFGLKGNKFTIPEIASEFNLNEKTVRRDRAKAMEIIELELGFKFS